MKERLKKFLPTRDSLHGNRWLRWLGPALHHPRLWHMSRKGIALGVAVGMFFGLLIPVAQIPFSAALAVLLRANLPVAMASTLVTNPVTFGPVYYGAYHLGKWVLLEPAPSEAEVAELMAQPATPVNNDDKQGLWSQLLGWLQQLGSVGKPLVLGLAILATLTGIGAYFMITGLWALKIRWARRRRLQQRQVR